MNIDSQDPQQIHNLAVKALEDYRADLEEENQGTRTHKKGKTKGKKVRFNCRPQTKNTRCAYHSLILAVLGTEWTQRKTLDSNDQKQVDDQRFSLKQWVYRGIHGYIGVYKGIHGYIGVYMGI